MVFLGDLPDPCQRESEVKPEREALEAAQDAFALDAEACVALGPIAPPATTQKAQRLDMTRLAEAIAALDALVHDKLAMYKTDKIREAAEEVARQFELMQRRKVVAEREASHDCVDPICPICGKELQQEEEFLYCPEHGGPLSALIDRQQQREVDWREGR